MPITLVERGSIAARVCSYNERFPYGDRECIGAFLLT